MDLKLHDKVALVTGATKGIGYAVAQALAVEGARLVISSRDEGRVAQAVSYLRKMGGKATGMAADVSKAEDIEKLMAFTAAEVGQPDILVSNAGGPPAGLAKQLEDDAWAKGYELTLMANVRLSRAVLPHMRDQKWGRIINITSVSIKQPVANLTLSNAFRAAVTGFAKTLSTEIAADNVTVNNVAPGYTATQRLTDLFDSEADLKALSDSVPAKRFAAPEEIAAAAVFLASQQAGYITGQTLVVDGGLVEATY